MGETHPEIGKAPTSWRRPSLELLEDRSRVLLDHYLCLRHIVVPVVSVIPILTASTRTVATPAPAVRAPAMMAVVTATPTPTSAEDAGDEKPEEDQLEDSATGQAHKEREDTIKKSGDTTEVPAYEFHHDP